VQQLVESGRRGALTVVTRFRRLVRLDRTQHSADITSAAPLAPDTRALLEAGIARVYGSGLAIAFTEDPALLGGVRVTVGSDVYDGSIRGGLAALEARL
jgi:F-type H+-transporting ATPase subunit delta